jgi:TldD protein
VLAQRHSAWRAIVTIGVLWAAPLALRAADEPLPDSDALLRALGDELERSMRLQMEDLEKPYFLQFDVDDTLGYQMTAAYGALTASDRDRSRTFHSRVRVGAPELDNTNFADSVGRFFRGGGGGGSASLPLDDDVVALRQAIWRATDSEYKSAVETLTKKRSYMKDKNIVERPNDFSPAAKVEQKEPTAVLRFDRAKWEANLKQISAHFKKYPQVQESTARLIVAAGNTYVVTSEGTRLRTGDSGALLVINAEVQAEDGMKLSDGCRYTGDSAADFPPVEKILADIDQLVADLTVVMKAPVLEHYSGPVLFDDTSAAQLFQTVLAGGIVGKPDPVGEQRRGPQGGESLDSKLGTRILPKTFQVWDDPTVKKQGEEILLGYYRYDHEGVPAARVNIVTDGKLEGMCLSRAPTRKLSGSNGHGRRPPGGDTPESAIGCLFIKDGGGVPEAELKQALITAAKEAGLEFGVRVKSIRTAGMTSTRSDLISFILRAQRRGGGGNTLGDPVLANKVYVADGHEEPLRGVEFGPVEVATLKRITAAGDTPRVYNYIGLGFGGATPPASIIAPPVLFEELELSKVQQEFDKLPILKAPAYR